MEWQQDWEWCDHDMVLVDSVFSCVLCGDQFFLSSKYDH